MKIDSSDRLQPTHRPDRQPVGHQRWRQLCFVHWRVPAETLQPLIPAPLEIDTYEGDAWLGLVPFFMSHVRPWWSPSVPWISNFCETNLRTYVHHRGQQPGVWFFSLDAARLLPVLVARQVWKLNYYWAKMKIDRQQDLIRYTSRRFSQRNQAAVNLSVEIDPAPLTPPSSGYETSLEFFLAERYLLYTESARGMLRGQVHHHPYPLKRARIETMQESLSAAAGCPRTAAPDHVLFSEGVDVEIFPLSRVD
ncbi:MAG: DUF2071 domain-containing protein [Mariniblastus sp.]|nr:DUF2071 domain-containing protein [Mariniblastus sp.]